MTVPSRIGRAALLALACALTMAHVGSPDTFFVGAAGPYPVRVAVRLPGVVPGLAQISVRVTGVPAGEIRRVTVQAIQWNVGPEGAPPPDVAAAVPGDPEQYAADLWFMSPTSYRVRVAIDGTRGAADCIVPVVAIATAQREMPQRLGMVLAGLGLFLLAGLLTIVGAAVRESVLPPGDTPDPARRTLARRVMAAAAVLVLLALAGGRLWWNAEAFAYAESVLFRPFASTAVVSNRDGRPVLTLTINDPRWPPRGTGITRYNALLPDHGKLMHMFLIREPGLDAFAHVHPVARQPATAFDVALPPLPPGRYRVYGDIVHESGYAQTLVASAEITAGPQPATGADPDDSYFTGPPAADAAQPVFTARDGTMITWQRGTETGTLRAGEELVLTFTAKDESGAPIALEPYMGMLGHVAIARIDGDVFAHLHPSGSVSMAALQKFAGGAAHHADVSHAAGHQLTTAYAFPKPGRYQVWVQVKREGRVVTAAFEAKVE